MMSKKELEILSCLRKDAKMTLTELSQITKTPPNLISGIIKNLEKKYIKKHTSIMNFSKIGYNLVVMYFIKHTSSKLLSFLSDHKSVNSLSILENNYLRVETIFKNLKERQKFVEDIGCFGADAKEYFIIEEVKREDFIPQIPSTCL
jgi:DNA-binding Lrp family transcriptional regulator